MPMTDDVSVGSEVRVLVPLQVRLGKRDSQTSDAPLVSTTPIAMVNAQLHAVNIQHRVIGGFDDPLDGLVLFKLKGKDVVEQPFK